MSRTPAALLYRYYNLWLKGKSAKYIQKSLKLSGVKFKNLTPEFLAYCRNKIKFETRANLTFEGSPINVELTEEREKKFLNHVGNGLSPDKAALIMNIPFVTVTEFWYKDAIFKAKVDIAVELCNAAMVKALYKRGVGYTIDASVITESEGTNSKGELYKNKTRIKKDHHFAGDVSAQKFYLYNRDPENWTIDGERAGKNNKAKIIEYIDKEANDIDNVSMKEYDEDQKQYDKKYKRKL